MLDSLCFIFILFVFNYIFKKFCLAFPENMAGSGEAVLGMVIVLVFTAVQKNSPYVSKAKSSIFLNK